MKEKFFSVCIPATNRNKTILRCLRSLLRQNIRDFEVIITVRKNSKSIKNIVKKFLKSKEFLRNPFVAKYKFINKNFHYCDDWNDPIKLAKGKFIVMLEGDDKFNYNHLSNAKNKIISNSRIIFYATNNTHKGRLGLGVLNSKDFRNFILRMQEVPTPSEAIFKRKFLNTTFYYDTKNYLYAPEIDLYIKLSFLYPNGLFAFSDKITVWRDPYDKFLKGKLWEHYFDHFKIYKKYLSSMGIINKVIFWSWFTRESSNGCLKNIYVYSNFMKKINAFPITTKIFLILKLINKMFFKKN